MKKLTSFLEDQKAPHGTLKGHRRDIGGSLNASGPDGDENANGCFCNKVFQQGKGRL